MAPHLTHMGVHDHGFNNVSTYGNLWRLLREGRIEGADWERRFYELALKVSGAVQARRWTRLPDGGFIHSFNGAHSLFVDTIRSLRSLALGHVLGQPLMEEQDARVSLLERLVQHARATAQYSVYYGNGRDRFDVRGRTAHESLFNVANGTYRGPSTQQGYSPFTTWTRGLAWAMLGFAEQLEFLDTLADAGSRAVRRPRGGERLHARRGARDLRSLHRDHRRRRRAVLGRRRARSRRRSRVGATVPADPFNDREPVDSSAAAIAAQGLLRLGPRPGGARARRRSVRAGRAAGARHALRRAVPERRSRSPGPAAALGVSLAERLGLRAGRRAARRAASRASGATITRGKRRSTSNASRRESRTSPSSAHRQYA